MWETVNGVEVSMYPPEHMQGRVVYRFALDSNGAGRDAYRALRSAVRALALRHEVRAPDAETIATALLMCEDKLRVTIVPPLSLRW